MLRAWRTRAPSKGVRGLRRSLAVVAMAGAVVGAAACSGGATPVTAPQKSDAAAGSGAVGASARELTGAGATFPYPLYSKWFDVYNKKTGVQINYQSVGSGAGIQQLTQRTVDFGASDAPMTDEQLKAAPGEVLHIPTVLGAVVVTYNLPGVDKGLKLSGDTLAGIFLGSVKRWSDPRIAADNPGVKLPDTDIAVVHRSDGSGTTNIFTDYLSAVSPEWKTKVGKSTSVNWPVGIGGKGNEGVAGQVKQTPGAIGYVELAYAVQNRLAYAFMKNRAGAFVEPTLESTTAAAAGSAAGMPEDLRVSIVNAPGEGSYPIAGYTYILVYREQQDAAKGRALVDFLWWAIHDGEQYATDLLYAPLPKDVVARDEAKIKAITSRGQALYR